jgi:hypothetical protein
MNQIATRFFRLWRWRSALPVFLVGTWPRGTERVLLARPMANDDLGQMENIKTGSNDLLR